MCAFSESMVSAIYVSPLACSDPLPGSEDIQMGHQKTVKKSSRKKIDNRVQTSLKDSLPSTADSLMYSLQRRLGCVLEYSHSSQEKMMRSVFSLHIIQQGKVALGL